MANDKRLHLPHKLLIFTILALSLTQIQAQTSESQSDQTLPVPADSTITHENQALDGFYNDLFARTLALKKQPLDHYQILYLASKAEATPVQKLKALRIPVVETWEQVVAQHTTTPLQLLIVDASAIDQVDLSALQTLYHHGTAIIGIGITIPEMITLTGDHCTADPKARLRYDDTVNFFNLYVFSIIMENSDELPLVVETELEKCSDDFHPDLKGGYYHMGFGYNAPLVTDEDYERLVYWIKEGAANFEVLKLNYAANIEYVTTRSEGLSK